MEELLNLVEEYLEQYPDEETPMNGFNAYGVDGLVKILKERKGRKIKWIVDDTKLDWQDYEYE